MAKVAEKYMKVFENVSYNEDVTYVCNLQLPWKKLKNKTIIISGATGLVGSFFVDVIMKKNREDNLNCKIIALGRNEKKVKSRFEYCLGDDLFTYFKYDVNKAIDIIDINNVDFVLHLASNTHPLQYSTDPIGTITTNIIGTKNMLDFAVEHNASRILFASSNEIYGENRGDVELFNEEYCGYINCNTLRAGYPESKRCGEALCQAYIRQKKMDVVIARLTRSYGPTLLNDDSKAISQFIRNGVAGDNIVLKSAGTQYYSFLYVADTVAGLLSILLKGVSGEAYNISDSKSDIMLKDLAKIIANYTKVQVVFELPDNLESLGYSRATKARLDSKKLQKLGWSARYDIRNGVERTIDILKCCW